MIFLFDVDNTITPYREHMTPEMAETLLQLPNFSFVTGSDTQKTIEQVGLDLFNQADYSFNCIANDVYKKGKPFYRNNWKPSRQFHAFLNQLVDLSPYPHNYEKNIEVRTGMVNFSTVGRGAVGQQRKDYYEWDCEHREREQLCQLVERQYPDLTAVIGGETGIDIYPKGADKSQCLKHFAGMPVHFFGDACQPGGNDYCIAHALSGRSDCIVSHVKDWTETWEILQKYTNPQTAA